MKPQSSLFTLSRHMVKYARPYSFLFVLAIVLMGVDIFFSVGNTWIQQYFIDIIHLGQFSELFFLVKLSLAVGVGCLAMMVIQFILRHVSTSYLSRDFSLAFFEQCNHSPLIEIQKYTTGDIMNRINKDAPAASNVIHFLVFDILFHISMCTVVFIYLARIDLFLALLALFGGPVAFGIGKLFDKEMRKVTADVQKKDAEVRSFLQEIVQGIPFVKSMRLEEGVLRKYGFERKKQNTFIVKQSLLSSGMNQSIEFSFHAIAYTCAFFVAAAAIRGVLTPGQVLAFLFLTMRLMGPFLQISQFWNEIQKSLGSGDRVFEIRNMLTEKETNRKPMIESRPSSSDIALQIKNGSFSYEKGKPLFKNLNLTIHTGESVAIIGPSGSGKSTLAKICCGLYELDHGQLEIMGQRFHSNSEETKNNIAYVPQDPYLFTGSIRDNIEIGCKHKVTMEEIKEAASLANALDFINRFEHQFDTVIKEKGSSLSGGQRQRIALARALIRKAPLIILDEVTSALDHESRRFDTQSILELLESGTTVVFVTHELPLAQKADRIIVMDNGEIVEEKHMERVCGDWVCCNNEWMRKQP